MQFVTKFVCKFCHAEVCLQSVQSLSAALQSLSCRGCAEAAQGLCRGCAGAMQRLYSGCTVAAQWLHSGCTVAVQRLCRGCAEALHRLCTGNPDRQLCRQTLSAENPPNPGQNADKYCRQILQTNLVCRKSAENWAKMQTNPADKLCQQFLQTKFVCTGNPDGQTLQTNLVCRKSAEPWPKCRQILQTNFVCKKLRRKLGQNVDKSCRQTLSRPKIAGSCRNV